MLISARLASSACFGVENFQGPATFARIVALAFVLSSAVISQPAAAADYSAASLGELNALFRKTYADARERHQKAANPVILARGDALLLLHRGKRIEGPTVSPHYHDLKAVAHVPLALFCVLDPPETRLSAVQRARLADFQQALEAVKKDLPTTFPQKDQQTRQQKLLRDSFALIDVCLRSGKCATAQLEAYLAAQRKTMMTNTAEAAQLRLDNYHRTMKLWRSRLDAAEWRRLRVIVPGAAMPRRNSLAVAYFAKLFQQAGESDRIIYAESRFAETQALQLLGTHLLDGRVGEAFFNDRSRMKRDLLGPAAQAHLDTLDFRPLRAPRSRGVGEVR